MRWKTEDLAEVLEKLQALWPSLTSEQAEETIRAVEREYPPHAVLNALQALYRSQDRPRRPTPGELRAALAEQSGGFTTRTAMYREIEVLSKRADKDPEVLLRGQTWELGAAGLARRLDASLPWANVNISSVPLGDLNSAELRSCLEALRAAPKFVENVKAPSAYKLAVAELKAYWEATK